MKDPVLNAVKSNPHELVVHDAETDAHIAQVRELFLEYAQSMGFSLCFQGFDQELAGLPGKYGAPQGRLLLAELDGQIAGCVGLRPLENGICEMKRLYVRPAFRGKSVGRLLAQRVISEARTIGYTRMRLDTIRSTMADAVAMYRRLGFWRSIPIARTRWQMRSIWNCHCRGQKRSSGRRLAFSACIGRVESSAPRAEIAARLQRSSGKLLGRNGFVERQFPLARRYYSGYYADHLPSVLGWCVPLMNIGETIRNYRLQKGMSQGDIEKRTGLLRCYLSRVENGHTIPSLDTLAKIAGAMELPLSQFFSDSGHSGNGSKNLPQLSEDEVRFLSQIRRYATSLNDSDRKLVLAMVKKMAASSAR